MSSGRQLETTTLHGHGYSIRVGLRRRGGSETTPLVIFNGMGARLELLLPFVDALDARPLLIVDAPLRHGTLPLPAYRFGGLAWMLEKALPELGFQGPVDIMGVSWGGFLAQQFAFQYPARCRRLVLAATSPGAWMIPARLPVLVGMLELALSPGPAGLARMAPKIFGGDVHAHADTLAAHLQGLTELDRRSQIGQLLAVWGWSSLPWLWRLRQPSLILAGRHDPVVPLANARLLAGLIPAAELGILEGGHAFLLARSEEAATRVLDFLSMPAQAAAHR